MDKHKRRPTTPAHAHLSWTQQASHSVRPHVLQHAFPVWFDDSRSAPAVGISKLSASTPEPSVSSMVTLLNVSGASRAACSGRHLSHLLEGLALLKQVEVLVSHPVSMSSCGHAVCTLRTVSMRDACQCPSVSCNLKHSRSQQR